MKLELWSNGTFIGRVVRSGPGVVYAYDADGSPLGTFGDIDAAAAALLRRASP